jgi:hypothetical protein
MIICVLQKKKKNCGLLNTNSVVQWFCLMFVSIQVSGHISSSFFC